MANIIDVANAANVSKSTVSNVFNNKKNVSPAIRQKVYKVAKQLNYYPNRLASSLAKNETNFVGLFLDHENVFRKMDNQLIEGIAIELKKCNKNLILYLNSGQSGEKKHISMEKKLEVEPIDSAILVAPLNKDIRINDLMDMKKPAVLIGKPSFLYNNIKSIDVDNIKICYEVTKLLIERGHSKIVLLNSDSNMTITMDRLQGYLNALKEFNMDFNPQYVYNTDGSEEMGVKITNMLTDGLEFTAIITPSDLLASGVYKALQKKNLKVPQDVSVFALGGTDATLIPEVSTVEVDYKALGIGAVNLIIKDSDITHQIVDSYNLRVTDSIAENTAK